MKFCGVGYKKLHVHCSSAAIIIKYFSENEKIISMLENFDVETIGKLVPAIYYHYAISSKVKISIVECIKHRYGDIGDPNLCLISFSHVQCYDFEEAKKIFYFAEIKSIDIDFDAFHEILYCHRSFLLTILFRNSTEEEFKWKLENIPLELDDFKTIEKVLWEENNRVYGENKMYEWQKSNAKIRLLGEFKNYKF
jgi:hypothetical protein